MVVVVWGRRGDDSWVVWGRSGDGWVVWGRTSNGVGGWFLRVVTDPQGVGLAVLCFGEVFLHSFKVIKQFKPFVFFLVKLKMFSV